MSSTEIVQQFKQLNRSSPQFPDQLTSLLYKKEYRECIPNLKDEEVVWLIEYLDDILDTLQADPSIPAFRRCLRELRRICGAREQLPKSYMLESSLLISGERPVASGGSGDVYEGSLNGSKVCVKRLRIYAGERIPVAKETLHREAVMWKRLTHPNIVPLLGVTLEPLQLISVWMSGGELREYITHHPGTDRLRLVFGVASGLTYLHFRNIIHGDLKGPNVLVDDTGSPRITDFGLAIVAQIQDSIRSFQGDSGHTARWTAPEILGGNGRHSKEADVFSFAMTMVEVFTGQVPFHPNSPHAAMLAILNKKRPERPNHPQITVELWTLMESCWDHDPHHRPEISTVLKTLGDSNPSFPNDWSSDVSTSYTLSESTESETVEFPESATFPRSSEKSLGTDKFYPDNQDRGGTTEPGEGGSMQGLDDPQASPTGDVTSGEIDPDHSEGEVEKPSTLIGLRPLRRGTDQSVQTPLPIDPPQFTFDDPVDGFLRADEYHAALPAGRGISDTPEGGTDGLHVGNDSRSSPHHDSAGNVAMTQQSGLQGGNLGASRSILTLPDQHRTGSGYGGGSQNPSRAHLIAAVGPQTPGNPSQILHERGAGTKARSRSQVDLLPGVTSTLNDSLHSGPGDGKLRNPSGRAEPSKAEESTGGKEGSGETLGVTLPSSKKPRPGIWSRIKRMLGCVSDYDIAT